MGTQYNISWVAAEDQSNHVKQLVDNRLKQINKAMSTYDPQSELSQINSQKPKQARLSKDLADVMAIALEVNQKSGGLFDVTVGPLVNLWGFGPDPIPSGIPDKQALAEALGKTGSEALQLDDVVLTLQESRYIDLSAVAKGWAVDEIAQLLEAQGYQNYLVEIGGELLLSGKKPTGQSWKIAIERPVSGLQQRSPQLIIAPGDRAVATSGDYRNYFEKEDVRYSHTIDSRNGWPIRHKLASVTVVHESSAYADAWATALNVAGPQEGLRLAEQNQLAAYMIVRSPKGFEEHYSKQFAEWFPDEVPQTDANNR